MNSKLRTIITFIVTFAITFTAVFLIQKKFLSQKQTTIYFVQIKNNQTSLVPVKRYTNSKNKLKFSLIELLKGPYTREAKKGIYSEIPKGTKLLDISNEEDKVEIDLSKEFESGGGSESMSKRVEQVVKTIKGIEPNKTIKFEIENKDVDYIGGEGVELPANDSKHD